MQQENVLYICDPVPGTSFKEDAANVIALVVSIDEETTIQSESSCSSSVFRRRRCNSSRRVLSTFILFVFFLLLSSCQESSPTIPTEARYLHIAHTRSYSDAKDKVMTEVETIDYSAFDVVMLGGDLAYESSGSIETLQYLDSVFDLRNSKTLWTLGNHDYQHHPELIPQVADRPSFYSFYKNGITFLNLDSQEDRCNTHGAQFDLFKKVTDTLKETQTLIIMHHKLIWMLDNGSMQKQIDSVSNGGFGGCFHCVQPNNFYPEIYPKLVELKKSGIQVICIAGDIGVKVKTYEYVDKEGIVFLASGLKDGSSGNQVLVFKHKPENGILEWNYEPLNSLPQKPE